MSNNGTNTDFALVRYNTNGSLDTTFNTNGKVTTAVGSGIDAGYSVTIQSDGKILVAGYSSNGTNNDFALVRYNSDGSLDTIFDTDGKVITAVGSSDDFGRNVTVQSDGKILIAGISTNGNQDFALVRYNTNGSLDTTFDTDGIVTTAAGAGYDDGYSVTVQSDGKILVAGVSYNGTSNDFALVRYNTDGSLDTTFDTDGIVTTVVGTNAQGRSVTVQSDGKILVAGLSNNGTNTDFALVRYNTNGSLDTTFDTDGIVTTAAGAGYDDGYSVTVQSDGKILVAGLSNNGTNDDFALVRYNSNGSLDAAFNTANTFLNNIASYTENGTAVVLNSTVQISDAELTTTNYNGATLTLTRNGSANAQDIFTASVGSIGTITTNAGGNLVVTFNSSATQAAVNAFLSSIAYSNSSDAPPASVQIDWTFNDGNVLAQGNGGALSVTGFTTVNITAVNDAPTVTAPVSATFNPATGHSYLLSTSASWQDAENQAVALGGHLATVNDAQENEFLRSTFAANAGSNLWIGYKSPISYPNNLIEHKANFQWVGDSSNYTNWYVTEPNYSEGAAFPEILAEMSSSGTWNDKHEFWAGGGYVQQPGIIEISGINSFNEDTTKVFAVSDFNYSDSERAAMANVKIVSLPASGSLQLNNVAVTANQVILTADIPNLTYTPLANFNGTSSLSYQVSDGSLYSADATMSLNVAAVNDAPIGTIAISGIPTQGETLSANNDLADSDGLGAISYQWKADGSNITDATDSTYILTQNEVGKVIAVTASYTDLGGAFESVMSFATTGVENVNDIPTLTTISAFTGTEDTEKTILFSDLTTAGNQADIDGTVTAFVVQSVSTGMLKIGTDSASATAWVAGT